MILVELSYKMNNFLRLTSLFFNTFVFYFLGGLVDKADLAVLDNYGGAYFSFVLFGLVVSMYQSTAQSSFAASLRSEQVLGTLEPLMATGTGLARILIGFSLYDFFLATIQAVIVFALGVTLLGVKLAWANLLPALLILVLSILAFIGFGLISAAFVMVFKRGDPLGWVVGNLSILVGGVYYPVEILPLWLQKLALLLPLTHSLKALRQVLLNGASMYQVRFEVFALVIFVLVLVPLSLWFFRYAVRRVTMEGTLAGH